MAGGVHGLGGRRPTNGSLRDGWDLARSLAPLSGPAAAELAAREAAWRYDGQSAPIPRGRLSGWARRRRLDPSGRVDGCGRA